MSRDVWLLSAVYVLFDIRGSHCSSVLTVLEDCTKYALWLLFRQAAQKWNPSIVSWVYHPWYTSLHLALNENGLNLQILNSSRFSQVM